VFYTFCILGIKWLAIRSIQAKEECLPITGNEDWNECVNFCPSFSRSYV